jgi:hypothetical protein
VRAVTGPGPGEDSPALTPERTIHPPCPLASCEHSTHMRLAVLCDGWEMEECLALWARAQTRYLFELLPNLSAGPFPLLL